MKLTIDKKGKIYVSYIKTKSDKPSDIDSLSIRSLVLAFIEEYKKDGDSGKKAHILSDELLSLSDDVLTYLGYSSEDPVDIDSEE